MDGINPLLAFALISLIIEITPGPNMTYLAALSLSSGMRAGFAAVAGIASGLAVYGIVAALGLAAVIDNSPLLYGILRWGGVAFLLWLAWEAWSSERETSPDASGGIDTEPRVAFRRGLITNLLNPKAAVFYVAVLPEFTRPDAGSLMWQTLGPERDLRGDRDRHPCRHRDPGGLAAADDRGLGQPPSGPPAARTGAGGHRHLVCARDAPNLNCFECNCCDDSERCCA